MEQLNNTATLNDTAGVLPMDTGAVVNGIHDEVENTPTSSASAGKKKGRGRPPKSAGSTKSVNTSNATKRARGRPPKTGETSVVAAPAKKVSVPQPAKEVVSTTEKKRGRPSKSSTSIVQTNGISKPKVQTAPITNHQEKENGTELVKKKRGRPSGSAPKKAPVVVAAAVASSSKEATPARKRGRPSGSAAGVKKSAPKPKATTSGDGSAKKRGRPKKSAAASPPAAVATPVNETATVTPNNVQ